VSNKLLSFRPNRIWRITRTNKKAPAQDRIYEQSRHSISNNNNFQY